MNKPRLLVTGASGQLGRLVIEHLRRLDPAADITAMVRTSQAADELAPFRVATRLGDYTDPASLDAALTGIDRLLLISSSVLGQRAAHHKNVIEAATRAGVSFIAYTSILRADTSELSLAAEHLATEKCCAKADCRTSYCATAGTSRTTPQCLRRRSRTARSSAAPATDDFHRRADRTMPRPQQWYCCTAPPSGTIYELAGDEAFTLTQLAASVSQRAGKTVVYRNMSEAEYRAALLGMGLPVDMATMLAQTSALTAKGALEDHGRVLSRLIGHPTTPLADAVAAVVQRD